MRDTFYVDWITEQLSKSNILKNSRSHIDYCSAYKFSQSCMSSSLVILVVYVN